MKKWLVPVDFTEHADNACKYALQLAQQVGAEIILLHCHHEGKVRSDLPPGPPLQKGTEVIPATQSLVKVKEKLELMVRWAHSAYPEVPVQYEIRNGYPEEEILYASHHVRPSLILMGTRGTNKGVKTMWGSVTAHLIEQAHVPVLAIPAGTDFRPIHHVLYASYFDRADVDTLSRLVRIFYPHRIGIHVVYVFKDYGMKLDPEIYASLQEELKRHFAQREIRADLEYEVVQGQDLVESLDAIIAQQNIDLVVTTTHKRTEITRFTDPSATKQLLFQSAIPLMAFHQAPRRADI